MASHSFFSPIFVTRVEVFFLLVFLCFDFFFWLWFDFFLLLLLFSVGCFLFVCCSLLFFSFLLL